MIFRFNSLLATGGSIVTVSRLINRNVVAERGRTSMRLEPELWEALLEICGREGRDMSSLVRKVEQSGHAGGRTSAVRVFVLSYFRAAATEAGHATVGHGALAVNGHPGSGHIAPGSGVSEAASRVAIRPNQSAASWPL
jgi:predicted DNA-binding ribbon-helix-helix protein